MIKASEKSFDLIGASWHPYTRESDPCDTYLTCFSSPVPPLDLATQGTFGSTLTAWATHVSIVKNETTFALHIHPKTSFPLVFLFWSGHVSRERLLREKKRNIFVADILSLSYGKCLCPWVRDVFIQHLYTASIHTTFTPTRLQWAC